MKQAIYLSFRTLLIAIVAAFFVMIIHELCKSIAYAIYIKIYNKKYNKKEKCEGLFKVHRYIDPVGTIFAATSNGIFSKQYPFVIRSRKASFLIGLAGYVSMALLFLVTIVCYRTFFGHDIVLSDDQMVLYYLIKGTKYIMEFVAYFSATLFLVNLYPISTFDISLIVATFSPMVYLKIRKYDIFFKLIFFILSLIGIFSTFGMYIATEALGY